MNNKTKTLWIVLGALAGAGLIAAAIVLLPALKQARSWSDGIDAGFFTRYPTGDRAAWFVHGPVSSLEIDGKKTSFDEQGLLTPQGDLARLYDGKGRFCGFEIEGSEGSVTCVYNDDNLLISKVEDFDFSKGSYQYAYDSSGNLVEETLILEEGDSVSVRITRRFIILEVDAYKNWTLRRSPDGETEARTIEYFPDPAGRKALYPTLSPLTYSMIRRKNSPRTLYSLGERYAALGDPEKAAPLVERAAAAQDPDAMYLLARWWEKGFGREKDAERAHTLYEDAAEAGSLPATVLTADRLFAAKEYTRALPLLEKASGEGDALSSLHLADIYRNGWGVPKDQAEALLYYKTAAGDGNLLSYNRLGTCYENGRGCEPDSLSAFRAYETAAMFGQTNAQFNLGECYRKGIGVSIDRFKARSWYTNAANSGSAAAKTALTEMEQEDLDMERIDNPDQGGDEDRPAVDYREYFNF